MSWRARRTEEDFADEIRSHLDHEADRGAAEGLTPEEARAAAVRAFGNATQVREAFHESRRFIGIGR